MADKEYSETPTVGQIIFAVDKLAVSARSGDRIQRYRDTKVEA